VRHEVARPGGGSGRAAGWSRRRLGAVVAGAGIAVVAVGLAARWRFGAGSTGGGPLVGGEAPDFTLPALGGTKLTLSQLRGGPVVLNFWATWCAPCKDELPELEQVYRDYKDRGLVVLAVSEDDESSFRQVRPYVRRGSPRVGAYTFPVALDTEREVARRYRLAGLPGTYLIDAAGIVRAVYPGPITRQGLLELLPTVLPAT
jgi:peroxiredoxin